MKSWWKQAVEYVKNPPGNTEVFRITDYKADEVDDYRKLREHNDMIIVEGDNALQKLFKSDTIEIKSCLCTVSSLQHHYQNIRNNEGAFNIYVAEEKNLTRIVGDNPNTIFAVAKRPDEIQLADVLRDHDKFKIRVDKNIFKIEKCCEMMKMH